MSFRDVGAGQSDDLLTGQIIAEVLERLRRLEANLSGFPTPAEGIDAHGALQGLLDEDHPQYVLHRLARATGDLLASPFAGEFRRLPVGTDGQTLIADSAEFLGVKWGAGGGGAGIPPFTALGLLPVMVFKPRWVPTSATIDKVRVSVNTAPVGADLIVRLQKNGAAEASTVTTVTAGTNFGETTGIGLAVADGDYIQAEVTQTGTTEPGQDMVVVLE